MKNIGIVLLGVIVLSFCAHAAPVMTFDTGNEFLAACEDPTDERVVFACRYYVFGVADGIDFAQSSAKPVYCLDPHATMGQELRITIGYIKAHPDKTHIATAALISNALAEAFPCPMKK